MLWVQFIETEKLRASRIPQEYESKGYDVQKEYPLQGGKAVDLLATKNGEMIAIKVEPGKSDEKDDVRKCKEAEFNKVVVVRTKD